MMIDYYYCYTKSRGEVGGKCEFKRSKGVIIGRIDKNNEIKKQFMYKENIYFNDDNIKRKSEQSVNIENLKLENKFFYHNEGGWTKDLDTSENQNKIKYIKRLEKDINLINSLKVLMNETTKIINKNNCINMYEAYFKSTSSTFSLSHSLASASFASPTSPLHSLHPIPSPSPPPPPLPPHSSSSLSSPIENNNEREENFNIKSISVIKDNKRNTKYNRYISNLKWSTDNSYKIAVAYAINDTRNHKNIKSSLKNVLLYDLNRISNPYQTLYCKSFIKCLRFNHKNSDLLLGGSYDGTINLWDLRKRNVFCESSLPSISHKNVVHDICWLQSKTNSQCLSVSNDGLCFIWDIRNMSNVVESFLLIKEEISYPDPSSSNSSSIVPGVDTTKRNGSLLNSSIVNPPKGAGSLSKFHDLARELQKSNKENSICSQENEIDSCSSSYFSGSCIEWNLEAGPSKILIGTEEGYILSLAKRLGKNLEVLQRYGMENEKHLSNVSSINRIPTNLKYFISTDKWAFNIWSEDVKYPIISKYYDECLVTKGLWIKDSAFFLLGKKNGYIDIWNFLYNFNEPIIKHKICNCSINEIENHPQNKYVALGTETGDIHILKLGESFCKINSEEKNALDELFERESKREKNLEYIRKQLSCAKKATECLTLSDIQIEEDVIKKTEEEYNSLL